MIAAVLGGVLAAQDTPETPTAPEPSEPTKTINTAHFKPVAKALAELDTLNATPNYKAKYYIYLQSASWCGPCCEELPKIVKLYPAMKKKKVELILVGHDHGNEKVLAFLKSFKAGFPGIYKSAEGVKDLPGLTLTDFVPSAIVVDDKGRVLHKGEGSDVLHWETLIKKKPVKTRK